MSLQVWLPLHGNIKNQGLVDWDPTIQSGTTASYVDGKIGKALNAGGIVIPASVTKQILNNDEFSYACWIYPNGATDSTSERAMIFGNNNGRQFSLFQYPTSNDLHWSWANYNGSSWSSNYGAVLTDVLPSYQWTHIIVVYNKNITEKIKIYINGIKQTISANNFTSTSTTFEFDTQLIHSSSYHYLNDIRLYNHALSEKEVKELSKGLVLHYKLSGVGNPNLIITNSMAPQSGTSGWSSAGTGWSNSLVDSPEAIGGKAIRCTYSGTSQTSGGIHHPTGNTKGDLIDGATYTVSARIRASKNCLATFHNELQTINNTINLTTEWKTYSFSSPIDNSKTYHLNTIYVQTSSVEQNMWIECNWIKLEEGDKATPWIPISTDPLYNKLGLNDSIEYDCSGYGNDGTKNSITTSSDSARYVSSYVFNGSNAYIRTKDNLWKSDGATELSINFWANMDDWTAFNTRLYSCTEGGGYNVEPSGNNLSFSMSAYTNAEKSTYKYISDGGYCAIAKSTLTSGWHMFTYVYTTSGTKLYVDGDLKVNNTYTSYGVHYNMTAPLVIGAEATGSGVTSPYFNGKMNDFRLYYTALSTDDIKNLYQVSASIDNQGNLHAYEVVER